MQIIKKSFKNTFCIFEEKSISELIDIEVSYESKSGSKYFYTSDGMYRLSNHWGKLANSKWRLISNDAVSNNDKYKLGFANWTSFLPENNTDKLYYIAFNCDEKTLNYTHKFFLSVDNKAILRTSFDTKKRLKQARNILSLTNWANHFEYESLDILRKKIIDELIFTEKTFEQIKKEIYGTKQ